MLYADLLARQAAYLAAEAQILKAQEYTVGQGTTARRLTRADLAEVRAEIASLQTQIDRHPDNPAARGARRIRYLRPIG